MNGISIFINPHIHSIISPKLSKSKLPTHVVLENTKLKKTSVALVEQIRTLDKTRLINKITSIDKRDLENVKNAIKINLNIRGLDIFN